MAYEWILCALLGVGTIFSDFEKGNKKTLDRDIQRQLVGTNGKKVPKTLQNLKSCLTRKINFQALHIVFITLIDPSMRCIEAKNSIFPNSRCFSHPRNNQSKSESKFQNRNLVKLIYKKVLYNLIMLEVFIIVFVISTVL